MNAQPSHFTFCVSRITLSVLALLLLFVSALPTTAREEGPQPTPAPQNRAPRSGPDESKSRTTGLEVGDPIAASRGSDRFTMPLLNLGGLIPLGNEN